MPQQNLGVGRLADCLGPLQGSLCAVDTEDAKVLEQVVSRWDIVYSNRQAGGVVGGGGENNGKY